MHQKVIEVVYNSLHMRELIHTGEVRPHTPLAGPVCLFLNWFKLNDIKPFIYLRVTLLTHTDLQGDDWND